MVTVRHCARHTHDLCEHLLNAHTDHEKQLMLANWQLMLANWQCNPNV